MSTSSSSPDVLYALLGGGVSIAIILGIILISLLTVVICCVVVGIPLARMAKTAGYAYPWMAYFPILNTYLMFVLPRREFNIFNWIKTYRRDLVFWIIIGGSMGLAIVGSVLMIIPLLGSLLYSLISIAISVSCYIVYWRVYYDILMTFGQEENAMWVSIVSIFIPILFFVFLWIMWKNKPEYGEGRYYSPEFLNVN